MKKVTAAEASKILKNINTFFFDCDGVLWNGFGLLPKAKETIQKLTSLNKQVFYITNNNTKSREAFLQKFHEYGFDVNASQVLSTSYLAAAYVKNILKLDVNKKVYMIGMQGLQDEFNLMGIKNVGCGERTNESNLDTKQSIYTRMMVDKDPDVGAVVVGFDDHFSLFKISEAMQYLLDPNMPFIATNLDNRFPVKPGCYTPGTGVVVQAVATAAERQPIVLGKPNKMFLDVAQTTCDIDPTKTMMIGDRLNTDIQFGYNCGFKTLCILTGITTEKILEEAISEGKPEFIPDYVSDDLSILAGDD